MIQQKITTVKRDKYLIKLVKILCTKWNLNKTHPELTDDSTTNKKQIMNENGWNFTVTEKVFT